MSTQETTVQQIIADLLTSTGTQLSYKAESYNGTDGFIFLTEDGSKRMYVTSTDLENTLTNEELHKELTDALTSQLITK